MPPALEPTSFECIYWVVITVSVCYASMPLNMPTHPVSITSTTLCAGFTGLSPFGWCLCALFIELLFTSPEAYCRRGDTSSSRMAYITILASLGGPQLMEDGPNCGRYSTLVKTQVGKCVDGQEEASYTLSYQES